MNSYVLNLDTVFNVDDANFELICRNNPEIKFERNGKGGLIIMPPTGGDTGRRNIELGFYLVNWNHQKKLGVCFDSSTCFRLPSGALRSPDLSWIKQKRWNNLTPEEQEKFPPIAPDFVLKLMSPSDGLQNTRDKLKEYLENGVKLGWLINRKNKQIEIYRLGKEVEILDNPQTLSGGDILPDFILDIQWIW
jgi:Uma2 family endonuclease